MSKGLSLFDSVRTIFAGERLTLLEADLGTRRKPDEHLIGVLEDERVRNLYVEACCFFSVAAAMRGGSDVGTLLSCDEQDYREAMRRAERLITESKLLMGLFWQGVHDVLDVDCGNIGIRTGWEIVLCDNKIDRVAKEAHTSRVAREFLSELRRCLLVTEISGAAIEYGDEKLLPVDEDSESIVGTLTSPVLLELFLLEDRLVNLLPDFFGGQITASEIRYYNQVQEWKHIVNSIFWSGVEMVIPEAKNCQRIEFRSGWKVVSVSEIEEASGQEDIVGDLEKFLNEQLRRFFGEDCE